LYSFFFRILGGETWEARQTHRVFAAFACHDFSRQRHFELKRQFSKTRKESGFSKTPIASDAQRLEVKQNRPYKLLARDECHPSLWTLIRHWLLGNSCEGHVQGISLQGLPANLVSGRCKKITFLLDHRPGGSSGFALSFKLDLHYGAEAGVWLNKWFASFIL
jgi:hypothetical protein